MSQLFDGMRAPRYSKRSIIQIAENLIREYAFHLGDDKHEFITTDFDSIYDNYIYPEYEILLEEDCELGFDAEGKQHLGSFDIEYNTITLSKVLGKAGNLHRKRAFTCWHELGHALLHGDWLKSERKRLGVKGILTTEESLAPWTESILEQQANLFACHAAAPNWLLDKVISEVYQLTRKFRYIGPGRYCLYIRGVDIPYEVSSFGHLCNVIAYNIRHRFGGLSIESLSYRIANRGYVSDVSNENATVPPPFRLFRSFSPIAVPALASI